MDVFPKFIIETFPEEGDCLIISKVTFHNEMVTNKENVKGGGWFTLKNNVLTFRGQSEEFGAATIEDIQKCIELENIYTNPYLLTNISKKYTFKYDIGSEIIDL